jgi:hypothetical protein
MNHPLLMLLATQPHLLGNHADAYAELLSAELASTSSELMQRSWLRVSAICCWIVSAVLTGVSLMLLAVIPQSSMPAPWALIVVPLVPMAVALYCQIRLKSAKRTPFFGKVRQQIKSDMAMVSEASSR